jgi:radical SAM superfamily enzyme YgiQ (UPF0313 family)
MFKQVSLVALPKQDFLRPPGALPILAAACEDNNAEYNVYDFNLWLKENVEPSIWQEIDDNWSDSFVASHMDTIWYKEFLKFLNIYVDKILLSSPDLVSISIFSDYGCFSAFELIQALNSRPNRNTFKIAIGGTGIRAKLKILEFKEFCTFLLSEQKIDYFIYGEGEVAFSNLLKGIDYPGINNFDAVQIDDLDSLPFPSYKKINPRDYKYLTTPELTITGSKGCVRKCTYCDVAKYWPKFKYRSGQNLADEIWHYYKTLNITNFEFSDSLINGSMKQFEELNKAIIRYKSTDKDFNPSYKGQFICRSKNLMPESSYQEMQEAGCKYIYVGLESFSDPVRHSMEKKFSNKDFEWHLEMCGKYGIKNSLLMLVGYPTETLDDHQQNLSALKKYQVYAHSGIISMIVFGYTANILADTPLYHQMDELKITEEYSNGSEFSTFNWVSLKNPTLNLKERIRRWVELVETANSLDYLMPRNKHILSSFINLLTQTSTKKKAFKLHSI